MTDGNLRSFMCSISGEVFSAEDVPSRYIEQSSSYLGPTASASRSKKTNPIGGGIRRPITNFTCKSQQNMMRALSAWRPRSALVLATVTYPAIWPDQSIAQKHRKSFMERFARRWPLAVACWRLEYQKRGAPHYHFVIDFGDQPDIEHYRHWQAAAWAGVIGEQARCQADWIRNDRGRYYLCKEIGKQLQSATEGHRGRFWGWHNRKAAQFVRRLIVIAPWLRESVLHAIRNNYVQLLHARKQLVRSGGGYRWIHAVRGSRVFNIERHARCWLLYRDGANAFDRIAEAIAIPA